MPFETLDDSLNIRRGQYKQLNDFLDLLDQESTHRRIPFDASTGEAFYSSRARVSSALTQSLGYPLNRPSFEPVILEDREIGADHLVKSIRRLTILIDQGLEVYALLLLPHRENPPLVLCYHGGDGCPEMVCSVTETYNYHDGARRFVELGYAVLAPMFALRAEDMPDSNPDLFRVSMDIRARWAGTTIAAVELYKVSQTLKAIARYPGIQGERPGVAGLSYGGFYAFYTAALMPEIRWCVSSCYFNDRLDVLRAHPQALLDWQFPGAGALFSDADVAGLICPKPLYIEIGLHDELFDPAGALTEAERVRDIYRHRSAGEHFIFDAFDGVHEFRLAKLAAFLDLCR